MINFDETYPYIIDNANLSKYFLFTLIPSICVHNLGIFNDTGFIMASQRRCYARDPQNQHRFSTMHGSHGPLGNFDSNLGFIVYQN